ncbi:MAG: glycosyltransferase family 4 protein [Geobacteraceae bacterium]
MLHITAHLGGGVGKVLSRLIEESARRQDGVKHTIACMEKPEKRQFVEHVQAHGGELIFSPSFDRLNRCIAEADIVQLEWWHHPVVTSWLCSEVLPPMRLIVWSHVSGLHPPEIPLEFVTVPHRFLFTSPCTWEHPTLARLAKRKPSNIDVVFSSGGFDELPSPPLRSYQKPLRAGYVGTLNFAKLHPDFLEFLAAVRIPDFRVSLVGDPTTASELVNQAAKIGVERALDIRGYSSDVAKELARFDIMPYLLNPLHYGTTENALLEAMAMGVVPVVLNNPAERQLVRNGETGLVVDSPSSFADAISYLANHPDEVRRLSINASRAVRERFSVQCTAEKLMNHYRAVLPEPKRTFDFRPVFGSEPADWFRACIGLEAWRFPDNPAAHPTEDNFAPGPHYLYEKTKGSVFHYFATYPDDERLERWAAQLETKRW